jgi:hypothetical protein
MRDFSRHAVLPMCTGWYGDATKLFMAKEKDIGDFFLPI